MSRETFWSTWLAGLLAVLAAGGASFELAAQDILHLYVRSSVTEFYRVSFDTGAGFPFEESMANTFFPADLAAGAPRVNFPLPRKTQQLRVVLGEQPDHLVSGLRLCIERSLLVSRCLEGASLAAEVDGSSEANMQLSGSELNVVSSGYRPSLTFKRKLLNDLRPFFDVKLIVVRAIFFVAAGAFFFCFFLSLLSPIFVWWTRDAIWLFMAASALRALFFMLFQPGTVSDSDQFLRYLQFHIFEIPGIRGITYPAFTTLFGTHLQFLYSAQFLLGAVGSIIVLLLIRSQGISSRWDVVWALVATSIPTLLAMEALVLSESLSLFLVLATVLSFRWLQANPRSTVSAAGLGAACALLSQAKPQFAFVSVVLALILAVPQIWPDADLRAIARRLAAFGTPVIALQLFATVLTFSCGNFRGTSSTLGYSLFDHGQQSIVCPTTDADPHIQYYCQARAALSPGSAPYAYTAWLIYPAMHQLQEPFYRVTDDYAKLSVKLISKNPGLYARTVWKSFVTFWGGELPLTRNVLNGGRHNYPLLRSVMSMVIPAERLARDAIAIAFFLVILTALAFHIVPDREAFVFCGLLVAIVLISSVLQALVESGRENPRFEIPTEPLLIITIIYLSARLRSSL